MKRPLLIITVGYIIGIVWGLYCNCSIALLYACVIILTTLLKTIYIPHKKFKLFSIKRYIRYLKIFLKLNFILIIIISSLISNLIVKHQNKKYNTLYSDINNVTIKGVIAGNLTQKEHKKVYKLKVESLNGNTKFNHSYLLLNIKNSNNYDLKYGDRIIVKGTYIIPNTSRNYKGFNYKNYLKTKKIYGSINAEKVDKLDENCLNPIFIYSNKIFLHIKNNLNIGLSNNISNIILGIMLGYTDELDESIVQNFRNSNMAHVLAVSGMHIAYITSIIIKISSNKIGKRKSRMFVILLLIIYMFVVGFTPSIVRAGIMGILINVSRCIYRKNDTWNSIALSILLILIYNPFLITSMGLLLSYVGTVGILVFKKTIEELLRNIKIKNTKYKYKIKKYDKIIKYIKDSIAVIFSVQIVIMPIIICYFNKIGITFIISNLLLGIIIGPIIILCLICIILGIIFPKALNLMSLIVKPTLQSLIIISDIVNKLPLNKFYISTPNLFQIITYYFLIFFANAILKVYMSKEPTPLEYRIRNIISLIKYNIRLSKNKIFSIILIISIVISIIKIIPQNLKIHFLDVGQGDSTLIITPKKHNILIDGGGSLNSEFDIGESTLLPYLLDRKITKIDYMIISHFDQDHYHGCSKVIEELDVKTVIIAKQVESSENYEKFKNIVKEKRINVVIVKKGDKIEIENGLYLDFLWPNNFNLVNENVLNNNSIVCKLHYKRFSMLFTGDIEEIAEKKILKEYKNNMEVLCSTILKVGHHGSKTSSTQEFLDAVKPKIALIGVGKNNKFGHPNDSVLERLENLRCKNLSHRPNGGDIYCSR